jgi:[methyl-Co(III) methanol-specific corrinoid protein]:coenzyme M methyltransferase
MANATAYDTVMPILERGRGETERIPCINSTSVATIDFMNAVGARWPAAHKDASKMAKLASAAHRLCGLDNVSVPFCLTVEAEVLGAPVEFFPDTVKWPTVKRFIATDPADLTAPEDLATAGRIPVITEAIHRLKQEFEGNVPVNVYMVPPFTSISSYLVESTDFLKWLIKAPEKVKQFLENTLDTYLEIARIYTDAGADIITLHDMGASSDNISPRQFDAFVKPSLKKLTAATESATILNICGSALLIAERMVECGADAIAVEERTPLKQLRELVDTVKPDYPIIGNVSSYGVIYPGPAERIREAVNQAIKDGVDIVAPGCDFWLETPTAHIKAFVDATAELGTPGMQTHNRSA